MYVLNQTHDIIRNGAQVDQSTLDINQSNYSHIN